MNRDCSRPKNNEFLGWRQQVIVDIVHLLEYRTEVDVAEQNINESEEVSNQIAACR